MRFSPWLAKVDDFWPAAVKMISDMGFLQSLPLGTNTILPVTPVESSSHQVNIRTMDLDVYVICEKTQSKIDIVTSRGVR